MSEDSVTIYRKSNQQKKVDQSLINQFSSKHEFMDVSDYQSDQYDCYHLNFFSASERDLEVLLNDLNKQVSLTTVAEYYFEQAGETLFYVLINGCLEEFESFEDCLSALALDSEQPTKQLGVFNYDPKTTSLIKLYPKKAGKQRVIDLFTEMIEQNEPLEEAWSGEIAPLLRSIDGGRLARGDIALIDKGSFITIALNFYHQELFCNFPDSESIANESAENQRMNVEIRNKQMKNLAELGFEDDEIESMLWLLPVDEAGCAQSIKTQRLGECAEIFLEKLLQIKGVNKAVVVIRSQLLDEDDQIGGQGSHKEGVLFCHLEELSDLSDWVN